MLAHRVAVAVSVGQGQDESNGPPQAVSQDRSLQLGSAQLGLEVEKRGLDLQDHQLGGTFEEHVSGAAVGWGANRHLEADMPGGIDCTANELGNPQLPVVAQPYSICGEEAEGKVMAGGCGQPMHDSQARQRGSSFRLAHERLADPSDSRYLPLSEAGDRTSGEQLPSKPRRQVIGARGERDSWRPHPPSLLDAAQLRVTSGLPGVC